MATHPAPHFPGLAPDEVLIELRERDFHDLPAGARELIRVYGGARCRVLPGDILQWRMPRARWAEVTALLATTATDLPTPWHARISIGQAQGPQGEEPGEPQGGRG